MVTSLLLLGCQPPPATSPADPILDTADSGGQPAAGSCAPGPGLHSFVTRDGDQLVLDGEPFRFVGMNVPNLHVLEDPDWHLPEPWEQRDALCSVRQMGGTVTRIYTLSVGDAKPRPHVLGPGELDEELMVVMDHAVAQAGEQGVRLIVPFVDQWHWWGGVEDYAAWHGLPAESFWTDERVIEDFEAVITAVLERENTVTGLRYSEDPAILGWETGNELDAPSEWTARIAAHVRSLDDHHLVIDGAYGVDPDSLDNDDIDVVSNHYYWPEGFGEDLAGAALADLEAAAGKPLLIGEYGFVDTEVTGALLDVAVEEQITGVLMWSLRFHDVDGGFYWHGETQVGDVDWYALHWPGFASGEAYQETALLELTRQAAYAIRGQEAPDLPPPEAPVLFEADRSSSLSWRGSAGAASYTLERAEDEGGPWEVVLEGFDDAQVPNIASVSDPDAGGAEAWWYRLRAVGPGGASEPSEPIGPVEADTSEVFEDPLDDLTLVHDASAVTIDTSNASYFEGDTGRLMRATGGDQWVVWSIEGLAEVEALVAWWPDQGVTDLRLEASGDGEAWTELDGDLEGLGGDWLHGRLRTDCPEGSAFLRLTLLDHTGPTWTPQVRQVVLTHE